MQNLLFRASSVISVVLAGVLVAACSGQHVKDPDGDGDRNHARAFSKLGPTEDELNPRIGDREDWRFVRPERSGQMEMRISVGKWEESTLAGHVTIFTEVGDRLSEKALPTGAGTLKFKFDVEDDLRYLVRFKATRGKGQYAVEVDWGSKPCAECPEGTECQDNQCVKVVTRSPTHVDKCKDVNCPSGEVCSRSSGRCYKPRPRCSSNQVLKGGECVDKVSNVDARIIDARPAGGGSLLIISAGANKGVKVGAKGSIKGLCKNCFTITNVYPSRSKAKCSQPPAKIYSHPNATIYR